MSFVLTLPWRRLVFAVRDRDGTNKNEIAISVFGVTTKDFSHDVLPTEWLYITCNEERRPTQCSLSTLRSFLPSGLDFQRELATANIQLPIIFITGYGDIPMTVQAMKEGAIEFLAKPFREQELLDAIQLGLGFARDALQPDRLYDRQSPRAAAHGRRGQRRDQHDVLFRRPRNAYAAEHIMASGALPPAFPAINIEGQFYWDGGILSNTPTEAIFDDLPRHNSLIFAVHLWNPKGPVPRSILEALHRQKDIQYSSRIASHAARQQQAHRLRHVIGQLVEQIPVEQRKTFSGKKFS
jgi:CheY-like chemotaxis protein